MAGFGTIINSDVTFNVTNGALNETLATQINNLEHLLIHGKHQGVRFYYDQTSGGNVLTVMTKSLVGGAVSELGSLAKNVFKDLLWKDDNKPTASTWYIEKKAARKKEQDEIKRNGLYNSQYGAFPVNNYQNYVYAVDHGGYLCNDALMLGIPLAEDKKLKFSQKYRLSKITDDNFWISEVERINDSNAYQENNFETDHLVWYDCTAVVSVDSSKNLVITSVQGRDYSRKELVSNGDINISVNGYITSPFPDIYPFEEVKKLRQILRYKGVIKVNNQILDSWDIDKIIIKDFSFPQEEGGKAIQKYSFNAVAVQPVRLSEVNEDTIKLVTQPFETEQRDEENKWADLLNKQLERLKMAASDVLDVGISQGNDYLMNDLWNKL